MLRKWLWVVNSMKWERVGKVTEVLHGQDRREALRIQPVFQILIPA